MKKKKSMKKGRKKITASEFDRAFDEGRDITKYLDLRSAKVVYPVRRSNQTGSEGEG